MGVYMDTDDALKVINKHIAIAIEKINDGHKLNAKEKEFLKILFDAQRNLLKKHAEENKSVILKIAEYLENKS